MIEQDYAYRKIGWLAIAIILALMPVAVLVLTAISDDQYKRMIEAASSR